MGTILINESLAQFELAPSASVADVFEVVRDDVHQNGRIVVEVKVDEEVLVWKDGSQKWKEVFDPSMEMAVNTDLPVRMAHSLLEQVGRILPEVASQHRKASAVLRENPEVENLQQVSTVIDWWKELENGLAAIFQLMEIDLGEPQWKEFADLLKPNLSKITEQLREILDAIEMKDFLLIADLLEYEFAPLAEDWQEVRAQLDGLLEKHFPIEGEGSSS